MFRLDQKAMMVTGGGSGIGKAIAALFARQGALVHVLELDEQGGGTVVGEILGSGGKAVFWKCNVAVQLEVEKVVEAIVDRSGPIDILINNAGIANVGNAENTSEADVERLFQVNVKGVYNCLHAVIPSMKNRGGTILNMASVVASVGYRTALPIR